MSPLEDLQPFLPAALAEAGLEITFKVCNGQIVGGGGRDIFPPPPPNLAGEVVTLVQWWWVGTTVLISTAKTTGLHATTAKSAFADSGTTLSCRAPP